MATILYDGISLKNKKTINGKEIDPYLPSKKLIESVKLAQILQRPLLVKGEPGCGKSRLAEAVAIELHRKEYEKYYFEWNVKSTSKALDGLYTINNLQRLGDANIRDATAKDLDIKLKLENNIYQSTTKYLDFGELGKAFQITHEAGLENPPIVLIDEVDKADIDFPNDLLLELDRMEFKIPEAKDHDGKEVVIKVNKSLRPLFIITSNDEKALPTAFLRRCLFHYIDMKEIDLDLIVAARFPDLENKENIIPATVQAFWKWRDKIEKNGTSNKSISTSELLDWVKIIRHYQKENKVDTTTLINSLNSENEPPHSQALLKDVESFQAFLTK
jgi:MoxR-like ATPase